MTTDEPRDTVPSSEFLLWRDDPAYPDPTPEDLKRPEFEAVWRAIRGWDIGREPPPGRQRLYAGATGNEVMHILNALPKTDDGTVDAVRQIIAEWEGTTVAQTASCQAEHAARHLDRIRTIVRGGTQ